MRQLRPAAPLVALILASCGGDAGAGDEAVAAVDTVAGVERFQYAAEAAPLDWSLDTLLVLGDPFAEDEYQFDQVSAEGLAADAAGNLLVLDRQGGRILKYAPDGSHMATYGRKGEGPGELSQPMGMAVGPDDTIWVTDITNSRITGYPQDGGEPRSAPFRENATFPLPRMAAVEGGRLLQFRPLFNFRRGAGGGMQMSRGDGDEEQSPTIPLVRYDADLEPGDTLWTTVEPPTDMVQLEMGDRVMITMMAREYHPEFLWGAFSDGGVVVSDTADYVLHLVDDGGAVQRVIERGPPARAVTEDDRESARQRVREASASGGGAIRIGGGGPDEDTRERVLQQRLEKMTFADRVPRVVALAVDRRDRIWVGVSEEVADEVARIDVYDRDGRLVGELRDFPMPDVFLDDHRIGVLRRDELDVQQVVVLEVAEGRDAGD